MSVNWINAAEAKYATDLSLKHSQALDYIMLFIHRAAGAGKYTLNVNSQDFSNMPTDQDKNTLRSMGYVVTAINDDSVDVSWEKS